MPYFNIFSVLIWWQSVYNLYEFINELMHFGKWLCNIYSWTCIRFEWKPVSENSAVVNRTVLINQSFWCGIQSCYWNGLANRVADADHLSLCVPSIGWQQKGMMSTIESLRDVSKTTTLTCQLPCGRTERNICAGLVVRIKLMTKAWLHYTPTGDWISAFSISAFRTLFIFSCSRAYRNFREID